MERIHSASFDHRRRPETLRVNGRRVGRHQHIEFAKAIPDRAAVESHSNLTNLGINAMDGANVAQASSKCIGFRGSMPK